MAERCQLPQVPIGTLTPKAGQDGGSHATRRVPLHAALRLLAASASCIDPDAPLLHRVHVDEFAVLTARHAQDERALTQLHESEDTTYQAVLKEAANVDADVADTACPTYYVALYLKHKQEQRALRKFQLAVHAQLAAEMPAAMTRT
ncbi:hypothetical protein SDRG_12447 [Saprolegnia diclina VS20]|uniref:Uncharacterized protein n=1 Tax=Saprolegnia diclina (strain VS20) TaxID=1156394 RepID=T0RCF9_SAPDV|nr:hypothetical protein SDRG_12447 [Saprolegnia diclina VS20]EQC29903.1 hypothetical protein SDRG_12447 [Saprolegnia diclina VS20]|eukprot:XP_008616742.1 hypothetical protein SDRG_12447 [Saprolegnia diclina VS20]